MYPLPSQCSRSLGLGSVCTLAPVQTPSTGVTRVLDSQHRQWEGIAPRVLTSPLSALSGTWHPYDVAATHTQSPPWEGHLLSSSTHALLPLLQPSIWQGYQQALLVASCMPQRGGRGHSERT